MVDDGRPACFSRKILMDATPGNTGIAYAMTALFAGSACACAFRPMSRSSEVLLHAHGAELIFTDPMDPRAIRSATIGRREPERYFIRPA